MFARTTTIPADPAKVDDGIAHIRDSVVPAVTAMDGCVGMSMLVDRVTGRCIATTSWASQEALNSSAETVRPLREAAERSMGATGSSVDAWEVAVVHRDHAMPTGAFARVTWLRGEAGMEERAADIFKLVVLPRMEEFDGFCSASMLIDRDTHRAVSTVTFERRDQLEATRDAVAPIREAATKEAGATVEEVAEMEVALAHLHLPEMV